MTNYLKALILYAKTHLRKFYNPLVYAQLKAETEARKNFYSGFVKSGDLAFDIGANLGNRILPLLNIGANVVAAEPQSLCYFYLNLFFGKKITCLKIALGAKKYQSIIRLNVATTISSMSDEWIESVKNTRFKNLSWNKTEKVNVDTLDNLILKYGNPRFIKIDVEGFEAEVLKGLSQPVPVICFEYTTPERLQNVFECLDLLDQLDKNYLYNYSIGESNQFALKEWINVIELKELINKNVDALEGFGDIYARQATTTY